ncbi:DUF2065 domain-containing protein [Legionella israelensis]|uniref:Uncharacterized protein n=1 Tax=Legionella israelensis TaxID=454 RepID=A0A0W0V2T8_9GAMM|nr:DUF2065 domain-containing protein [Legionella israelensis]KTD14448.1 hypothetical protein Lisr_2676 [Legionella israelensis]QBS09339.1 DUF2065 domain-containing protein [Legionella israelensis]QDP71813.1 DUF2065 domain-containing protein [Legionella israelensis]SCX90156.1 hypothetical protein SAMN02746069_00607 [Legionella israelensis DSM 19235]STX60238.1 Uncharacterized protein conserved in bacteria (DUF2065) [Legionella israelensis]
MIINFLSALALVLVLEGLMPFASPERWRSLLRKIIEQDEKTLRIAGFFSMLVGVALLTIIHQFSD